jgi:hypothetical protein
MFFSGNIENCRTPGCIGKKREKQYELFCDKQYEGPVERNCRKRWYLESNPRLQISDPFSIQQYPTL